MNTSIPESESKSEVLISTQTQALPAEGMPEFELGNSGDTASQETETLAESSISTSVELLDAQTEFHGTSVRISEIFFSVEGEGPLTGRPTLFIRTFGCNFTCSGFSNPSKKKIVIDQNLTNSIEDAPTDVGCDSIYSWHEDYRKLTQAWTPEQVHTLANGVLQLNRTPRKNIWDNVVLSLTGGEPMLHQKFWVRCLPKFKETSGKILIETNGSVPLHPIFQAYLESEPLFAANQLMFSISPKLKNSGEPQEKAIKPEVVANYLSTGAELYLKFVTDGSDASLEEIKSVVLLYNAELIRRGLPVRITNDSVWLMPEGATERQQKQNMTKVAKVALREGFNFSARVHVWIWGNTPGT